MKKKKLQEDYIEVERANMEAWNQHAIYWHTHESEAAKKSMKLKLYEYLRTFSKIEILCDGLRNKKILDVGCAAGTEMDFLFLKNCYSLVGVDISREMLKFFLKKVQNRSEKRKISLVMASAESLPFRSGVFDTGAMFHTLHHCPRPKKAIEELTRTSKHIILLEPNRESVMHRIAHFLKGLQKRKFSVTKLPEKLVEFQDIGFTRKEIENQLINTHIRQVSAYTTDILPIWLPVPSLLTQTLLSLEEAIQKIPILRWQLGSILIVAKN